MPAAVFELQGHRGARGLKSENTLPAFEAAFDLGVSSIETDVHLTADDVPILFHDSHIGRGADQSPIRSLPLSATRGYRIERDPRLCPVPNQDNNPTALAILFADRQSISPFTPPTLSELFAFATAYSGDLGKDSGKSDEQRNRASKIRFDLELKRMPFRPTVIGDGFDGQTPGILEKKVIHVTREAELMERVRVRSFDHRCIRAVAELEPNLERAILIERTAPVSPVALVQQARAQIYCPEVDFLDERQVRQIHEAGFRVIPWTVNDSEDWQKLLEWGVDGITTDFPDRLAEFLTTRGIAF
jgi:glycerophosphoryl diester phosphodiesterase